MILLIQTMIMAKGPGEVFGQGDTLLTVGMSGGGFGMPAEGFGECYSMVMIPTVPGITMPGEGFWSPGQD